MNAASLFVVSAPSGAGKTTLLKMVMAAVPGLAFSVSHTTRPPRPGEQHGRDYFFVDQEEFQRIREAGGFLEWAEVHGNYYGTARRQVEERLEAGTDMVLDIDVQGAAQVRRAGLGRSIFIMPPSPAELERRLRGRGTEDEAAIARRLANARAEMARCDEFDFLVVNDKLSRAADLLRAIILAERAAARRDQEGRAVDLSWD